MSTIKVIKALWGGVDVKDLLIERCLRNNEIHLSATNDTFWDTNPGFEKRLEIEIEHNGETITETIFENANFHYPFAKYKDYPAYILTSCNRVEQVCLALSVNSRIINKPFHLIIADGSTPKLDVNSAIYMHRGDDPYNLINENNYNSNWKLFEEHIKTLPNVIDYRIINQTPRLEKQVGEAELMMLGTSAAAMMGSKYGIKLTGVCHLKRNPFDEVLGEQSVYTWKRTGYSQRSTRVVMFKPDDFSSVLAQSGYKDWVYTYDFIERKLEKIVNNLLPAHKINHMDLDERDIIVDEGIGRNDHREIITQNLIKHNLLDCDDKYIQSFVNGNIW